MQIELKRAVFSTKIAALAVNELDSGALSCSLFEKGICSAQDR